ncbi:hypothetical protein [Paenibacillus polymyxa]|uniref:hypothetical protein n=1 Tax=Paenibacillus polymyxa TaxID=1406 RepID=UPI00129A67AF|nr:hypothetical protein [Paenibacillus polymyxa]KAE8559793.1 hypothetical protein BJH92_12495 [Paenibacillus polymyxa]MCJ1222267.1 hypothetical protein [Paenibacillus polymyxa]
MTDIQFIAGVFTVGLCAAGVLVYRITRVQQDTIRDLTNKLMAKDYGEYKAYQQPVVVDDKPKRKPLSYHDDPDIDEDDEDTSRH